MKPQNELNPSINEQIKPGEIYSAQESLDFFTNPEDSKVDFDKLEERIEYINEATKEKPNRMAKYLDSEKLAHLKTLDTETQIEFVKMLLSGLVNADSSMGVYAQKPEDYTRFGWYFDPILADYHAIPEGVTQESDWNIPIGEYLLDQIDHTLTNVSMRARVARNVEGWNLPSSMDKSERLRFEEYMIGVFNKFGIDGKYMSLTPGSEYEISEEAANELIVNHLLFNDMSSDRYLTAAGIASDWPHGRGMWLSSDRTKMIWVGEEDQLRVISIVHGNDLGVVDNSLKELLTELEKHGVKFATHQRYGNITTCPTNLGTGKRQSVLVQLLPEANAAEDNIKQLKDAAKNFGLQLRGTSGEHSASTGTFDVSPMARFGVSEAAITSKLYDGLRRLKHWVDSES